MSNAIGKGFCPNCDKEMPAVGIDFGIGTYEYWGSVETHVDIHICCEECEEELEDWDTVEPDYPDRYPEDDWREDR